MDQVYEFDIYYTTHEYLQKGITELGRSRIEVLAKSYHDAWEFACHMVIGRSGFYITRTEYVA